MSGELETKENYYRGRGREKFKNHCSKWSYCFGFRSPKELLMNFTCFYQIISWAGVVC